MNRALSIGLAACLGLALIWLAGPRLAGRLAELPARPIVAELRSGARVAPHHLDIAVTAQSEALRRLDDGRGWAALGLLHYEKGRAGGFAGDDGRELLERAITAHRRGLALSPAQAYAWARLAQVELLRSGPAPRLGPIIELAIAGAPADRRLAFRRLEIGFLVWRHLDPRTRRLVAEQIRFAAELSAPRLAKLAKRRYAMAATRAVLEGTPLLLRAFDTALRRL